MARSLAKAQLQVAGQTGKQKTPVGNHRDVMTADSQAHADEGIRQEGRKPEGLNLASQSGVPKALTKALVQNSPGL